MFPSDSTPVDLAVPSTPVRADEAVVDAERRAGLLDGVPCAGGIVYLDP